MARHKDFDVIISYNFDIVITDNIDFCGLGIMRYLGLKNLILYSTTPLHDNVAYNLGVPYPASYIPSTEENLIGPKMTFFEKLFNFYSHAVAIFVHHYGTDRSTETIRKYAGLSFPNLRQIASESTLAVINSDEFLDIAHPILHKKINIGGLVFIHGVIIFSLGTVATIMMNTKVKENLIQTFMEFEEYNFLMKIDESDDEIVRLATKAKNILTTTWMPQSDILG